MRCFYERLCEGEYFRCNAEWIQANGKRLILGFGCVLIAAIQVVGSACGDRTPEIQRSNLFDLNAKYADVVTEEDAIEKLEAGWV